MGEKRDCYAVLGVGRDADGSTIKKAYRKLAKKYHPDTSAGNARAEEKFREVTEAYEILSDPEKRKLYDRYGRAAFDGSAAADGGPGGHYGQGSPFEDWFRQGGGSRTYYRTEDGAYGSMGEDGSRYEYHFRGEDVEDILKNLFGGGAGAGGYSRSSFGGPGTDGFDWDGYGADGFGGAGFGNRSGAGGFESGADLQAEIFISFDEAVFGCDKAIRLEAQTRTGPGSAAGSGTEAKSLKVHIPAGIDTGKSIRLKGKGRPGRNGTPGDLLLKVNVGGKPGYERHGMDVYTTIHIPFATAVFGGEVTVQTLYGKVLCKVKEGTQSGTKIRLKGKGIVSMKDPNVHGDQYVTVQIQVPTDLNEEARRKLKEFEKACGGKHRSVA